jgi:hypothetical protein
VLGTAAVRHDHGEVPSHRLVDDWFGCRRFIDTGSVRYAGSPVIRSTRLTQIATKRLRYDFPRRGCGGLRQVVPDKAMASGVEGASRDEPFYKICVHRQDHQDNPDPGRREWRYG